MKKLILLFLCCALLCGCQPSTPSVADDHANPGASGNTTEEATPEATNETTQEATEEVTEESTSAAYQIAAIYHAYGVEYYECEAITPEFLVEMLKEVGILNEDVMVNQFYIENDTIYIDFNAAFGEQLNSYGTSGESITVGCTVNTFVENYQIPYVMFTVEGEIFESGHVIYDFPLHWTA